LTDLTAGVGPVATLERRRRGSGYLFLGVVVAQIVLISAQVTTRRGTPVLQAVAFGIVAEVQRGGAEVVRAVTGVWRGYFDLRGVRTQNEQLARELAETRIHLQQERALAQQSRVLRQLLELRERAGVQTTAAEVVAAAATPDFRTVTIGKGWSDGLKSDMAVLAPAGVVGRVIVPSASAAKVQLLIDRNAAAGALVERSRAQGLVLGQGDDRLRLEYLSGSADVKVGDKVVTSGIDGIYPKGFVIGRVEKIERTGGSFAAVLVRPAVDFSSLEDVLVVLTPPAPDAPAGKGR
jgi:rod shape-determining protein MreC